MATAAQEFVVVTHDQAWHVANYGGRDVVASRLAAVALLSNTKLELFGCHEIPIEVYFALCKLGAHCGQRFNTMTPWQLWCS